MALSGTAAVPSRPFPRGLAILLAVVASWCLFAIACAVIIATTGGLVG